MDILRGGRDPRFSTVIRIARGLGISLDGLMGLKPKVAPAPVEQPPNPEQEIEQEPEVKPKRKNAELVGLIENMPESDAELLRGIVVLLDERRLHLISRLYKAAKPAAKQSLRDWAAEVEARKANAFLPKDDLDDAGDDDDDDDGDFDDED